MKRHKRRRSRRRRKGKKRRENEIVPIKSKKENKEMAAMGREKEE